MSEKIYALLLRLYPAHFRKAYAEEALQLFRDRARDEKGFFPALRLWLDVLADLAFTVPSEYFHVQRPLISAPAPQRSHGMPAFFVLENESPRLAALLLGGLLSWFALGAIFVLSGQVGNYRPLSSWGSPSQTARLNPQNAASAMLPVTDSDENLDAAERQRVIEGAIANLNKYYVDPDVAQKTADALLAHKKSGDDDGKMDGAAFADLLTRQMKDVSHDAHLEMIYSAVKTLENPPPPPPEAVARYRAEMERRNCTFEKVEILPNNIGYLKFDAFPDAAICESRAAAAMKRLNDVDAIVFDLRGNRGGYANMVALLATYLFDRPTHLNDFYNRSENSTEESWTLPPVPGNRLADKPVFVLTSPTTFSAAEAFSYDLKMLKRATLVGETTSGRGHMGEGHRIDDHFIIRVPGIKAINPISKTNWDGTGVEPDVRVKAADALETAKLLAESKLQKK
jgi:hypothetical protein